MNRLVVTGIVQVLVLLALSGRVALACSCIAETQDEMIQRSDLAVVAEAIAEAPFNAWVSRTRRTMYSPEEVVTLFDVRKVVAGRLENKRIAVVHYVASPTCGLRFTAGERYLLAFTARKEGGLVVLRTGLCNAKHHGVGKR